MDIKQIIQNAKTVNSKNKELKILKKQIKVVRRESKINTFTRRLVTTVKIKTVLYKAWVQKNSSVIIKTIVFGVAIATMIGIVPDKVPVLGDLSGSIKSQLTSGQYSALVGSGISLLFIMGAITRGLSTVTYSDLSETTKEKLMTYGYTDKQLEIAEEGLELFVSKDVSRDEKIFKDLLVETDPSETLFQGVTRASKEFVDITLKPVLPKEEVVHEEETVTTVEKQIVHRRGKPGRR